MKKVIFSLFLLSLFSCKDDHPIQDPDDIGFLNGRRSLRIQAVYENQVELINNTGKTIDLQDYTFQARDTVNKVNIFLLKTNTSQPAQLKQLQTFAFTPPHQLNIYKDTIRIFMEDSLIDQSLPITPNSF